MFESINDWPSDLYDEYYAAVKHKEKAIVALKGLSRLRADGTIDPDPKKIHTRIPELEALKKPKK